MSDKPTSSLKPKLLLRELSRRMPMVWDQVKSFRKVKGNQLSDWPDWCYIPLAAGYAIATGGGPPNNNLFDPLLCPASIIALATWRITQSVYRFDPDLLEELITQPFEGDLPCEAFKRLPEWCVYIEFGTKPQFKHIYAEAEGPARDIENKTFDGFFAHLEYDVKDNRTELRLLLVDTEGACLPVPLHLGDWTLEEAFQKTKTEFLKNTKELGIGIGSDDIPSPKEFSFTFAPFIQLVLYLCAENLDMPIIPQHPANRVRMSGQVDIAKETRIWTVGERIGASIRKYHNEQAQQSKGEAIGTHASPRPHMRRAHWHHFWTGPKTGERKLILRWLPPIPVGVDENQEGPVVIHRVK